MSKIPTRPTYGLDKIKFATDRRTFERAVGLYEGGKVTQFEAGMSGFSAVVLGGKPYCVSISARNYDHGNCTCYLGQDDVLCKHMVAVAIYAVMDGKPLVADDKQHYSQPRCGGRLGNLSKADLVVTKQTITTAMRYIKPYNGPSRTWFAYQNSLSEGCNRLSAVVSDLPVHFQTAEILIDLLLRLDRKLCAGGVDDSDGTVGTFMEETVQVLGEFVRRDSACAKALIVLKNKETCFEWEVPLVKLIQT